MALAHPELELLGLSTTFGNASIEQTTDNAHKLLNLAGSSLSVAKGATRPSGRPAIDYPDFVHGSNGLGNIDLPTADKSTLSPSSATNFIIDTVRAHPGEVSLVTIGPLGNLASALDNAPDIVPLVKQVIIMGGTYHEPGNVSPVAEANIYCDPHAADKVLAADWPVTLIGLDVTHKVLLSRQLFTDIADRNPKVGAFLQQASAFYIDFYERERGATDGCYGHDISAIAYAIQPELFTVQHGSICVATEGVAIGQTIQNTLRERQYPAGHWQQRRSQQMAIDVDAEAVRQLFFDALCNDYWAMSQS